MRIFLSRLSRMGVVPHIPKRPVNMTGAQLVYQKLLDNSVKDVFLYSGGSIMPLIDCFYQGPIDYYVNTHEQNCGHAATGYAKSSLRTGVVITTSGPGITNMITPMLDAQNDSTPLVVISGQVPLEFMGTDAFQEAPAVEITKPVTKWSYCIQNTEEIPQVIDYAFYLANQGKKGVVHLDLPKCVSSQTIDSHLLNTQSKFTQGDFEFSSDLEQKSVSLDGEYFYHLEKQILEVSEVINNSRKPIFYLGQGCSHASDEILQAVAKNKIPVTSTIHGKGILPESSLLSLKWCGMHGYPAANYAIQESDCIIAVGSRFDDRTTGKVEDYAPEATEKKQIIHVDIDPRQFDKSVKSHYQIHTDSKIFLGILNQYLQDDMRLDWLERIGFLKNRYPFQYRNLEEDKINGPMVLQTLNRLLNHQVLAPFKKFQISTGVGNHQMMTYQFIEGDIPKQIHSSGSLGVMGAGLPYAIGIQIANPDDLVIDIDGDSSFMMTMSDMKTVVENNLPIKIAIFNDSKQMMVNVWEKLFFEGRYTATENKRNPKFMELAESFGIRGLRCESQSELEETTRDFLNYPGPCLCEYIIEPEICLPLVGPGKALDDMILFEDYYSEEGKKEKKLDSKFDRSQVPS